MHFDTTRRRGAQRPRLNGTLLSIVLAALCSVGCDSQAPSHFQVLTHADAVRILTSGQLRQGLSADGVMTYSGYTTQKLEGVAAPIDEMKLSCPDKVLSAESQPLYGLEAPYKVSATASSTDTIATKPITEVTSETTSKYMGDFVVLAKDGLVISLFPDGVATISGPDGETKTSLKMIQAVSGSMSIQPIQEVDEAGLITAGVQLRLSAQVPLKMETSELKDLLLNEWLEDPCQ